MNPYDEVSSAFTSLGRALETASVASSRVLSEATEHGKAENHLNEARRHLVRAKDAWLEAMKHVAVAHDLAGTRQKVHESLVSGMQDGSVSSISDALRILNGIPTDRKA